MLRRNDELSLGGKRYLIAEVVYGSEENRSWFYQAIDLALRRRVGIKQLQGDPHRLREAEKEAQVILDLPHERIPQIFDKGTLGDSFFMILEWLEGVTLRRYMEKAGPVRDQESYRLVLWVGMDLCRVLESIHRKKYFHRDLKPENIILRENRAYLIDYGLAAAPRSSEEGTERYCAPEQYTRSALAHELGPSVDIFSLGLILFELLTGSLPHLRVKDGEWDRPERASELNPLLPEAVDAVLARAFAYRPEARFRHAADFRHQLERLADLSLREAPQPGTPGEAAAGSPRPQGTESGARAAAGDRQAASGLPGKAGTYPPAEAAGLRELYNERLAALGLPRHVEPVLRQVSSGEISHG